MTDFDKIDFNRIIQEILDNENSMQIIVNKYYNIHGDLFLVKLGESVSKWHHLPALNNFKKSIIDYCNKLLQDSEFREHLKLDSNIMEENVRKVLEHLQTQLENQITWTNWDDSLFEGLSIDRNLESRLFSILKAKNFIDTMEPIGNTFKAVSINDNGTNYLYNAENKAKETKIINVTGNNNQINQDSSNNTNVTLSKSETVPLINNDKRNWLVRILNNNWTIGIVGAIIAGLIVAYIIFRLKWNK